MRQLAGQRILSLRRTRGAVLHSAGLDPSLMLMHFSAGSVSDRELILNLCGLDASAVRGGLTTMFGTATAALQ